MTATLAQIVAALSVTYNDDGVLIWLRAANRNLTSSSPDASWQRSPQDFIVSGMIDRVADAVRLIGDADPDDFTIGEIV